MRGTSSSIELLTLLFKEKYGGGGERKWEGREQERESGRGGLGPSDRYRRGARTIGALIFSLEGQNEMES